MARIGVHRGIAAACALLLGALLWLAWKGPSLQRATDSRAGSPVDPASRYASSLYEGPVPADLAGLVRVRYALEQSLHYDDAKGLNPLIEESALRHLLGEPPFARALTIRQAIKLSPADSSKAREEMRRKAARQLTFGVAQSTGQEELVPGQPDYYRDYRYRGHSVWARDGGNSLVRAEIRNESPRTITQFMVSFKLPVPSGSTMEVYCQAGNFANAPMRELRPGEVRETTCQLTDRPDVAAFVAGAEMALKDQTRLTPVRGQIRYAGPEIEGGIRDGELFARPDGDVLSLARRAAAEDAAQAGCLAAGMCGVQIASALSRAITNYPWAALALAGFFMGGIVRGMRPGRMSVLVATTIPSVILAIGVVDLVRLGQQPLGPYAALGILPAVVLYVEWFGVWLAGYCTSLGLLRLIPRQK